MILCRPTSLPNRTSVLVAASRLIQNLQFGMAFSIFFQTHRRIGNERTVSYCYRTGTSTVPGSLPGRSCDLLYYEYLGVPALLIVVQSYFNGYFKNSKIIALQRAARAPEKTSGSSQLEVAYSRLQ